ncbi:MAG: OmpA family protein [Vicingus serpentipes]|nr:OmpA family protein [Vicingus serpentipes]
MSYVLCLFSISLGQNNDCINLLKLTDTIYNSPAISGFGNVKEFSGNELENKKAFQEEKNSIWYLITMPDSGTFTFDIMPNNPDEDWDFLLYEHKKMFCERIAANKIHPIRSNLSRSAQTGLSTTAKQEFVDAGIKENYSKFLIVKKGDQFVLVVNNPKKNGQSHTLVLHYPQRKSIVPIEKKDSILQPVANIQFKLAIQSAQTKKPVAADVTINGFDKNPIVLTDITNYETNLSKETHQAIINVAAKGFLLASVDIKISKNKLAFYEEILLEEMEAGKKVNLKNLQFHGNSPEFLPTAESALVALLSFMELNSNAKIEIEGHVNGPRQRNSNDYQELSTNRAKAVMNYLIEHGIAKNRISFVGYGNTQMLYPYAKGPEEMSANRRVEIKILSK